jgi:hypothetical protein
MAVGRLMMPNNTAIIAITSNTWIKLPTEVKKTPIAQPISRITAIIYSSEFMIN